VLVRKGKGRRKEAISATRCLYHRCWPWPMRHLLVVSDYAWEKRREEKGREEMMFVMSILAQVIDRWWLANMKEVNACSTVAAKKFASFLHGQLGPSNLISLKVYCVFFVLAWILMEE
jgi:hypothetical protein